MMEKEITFKEALQLLLFAFPLGVGVAAVEAYFFVKVWDVAVRPAGAPRIDMVAAVALFAIIAGLRAKTLEDSEMKTMRTAILSLVKHTTRGLVWMPLVYATVLAWAWGMR